MARLVIPLAELSAILRWYFLIIESTVADLISQDTKMERVRHTKGSNRVSPVPLLFSSGTSRFPYNN